VKNAIFGANNARIYDYKPSWRAELDTDQLSNYKVRYAEGGAGRTNLAYGYALKKWG